MTVSMVTSGIIVFEGLTKSCMEEGPLLKNEDNLKHEDNLKNKANLKDEDDRQP